MARAAEWEAIVAGGGPAGAAAARALARAGRRVLLLDASGPSETKIGESLPGAARPLLRDLGLLPYLESSEPAPHPGNLSDWDGRGLVATDFLRDPHGHGWHLDRPRFDRALREAAQDAGADWQSQRLDQIERSGDRWQIETAAGQVSAPWLIDATGRAGVAARRLGIARRREEPRVAVYAFAQLETRGDARTLVERVAGGWWYTAALPRGRRVASFHTTPPEAQHLLREEAAFASRLAKTRHVRVHCPPDANWSPPKATDAGGSRLETFAGDGWLAIGDAALAFDPISSQGLFNALYTALRGAQAVDDAVSGNPEKVNAYAQTLENVWSTYTGRIRALYGQSFDPAG